MFPRRRNLISLLALVLLFSSFLSTAHAGLVIAQLSRTTPDGSSVLDSLAGAFGDCVTATATGNLADLNVALVASPVSTNTTATVRAAVYGATGTPGSSCSPNGSPIGRSNSVLLTLVTASVQNFLFVFAGSQQAIVANGQVIFVAVLVDDFGAGSVSVGSPTPTGTGPSIQNRETCATGGGTEIFDGNADIVNPGANCALQYACNSNSCGTYILDGTLSSQGPGSTQTGPQTCLTCNPPPTPPIDIPTPQTLSQIQPVLSTTSTIDSRPFIIIALLFFLVTLLPYLVYHKKSNLSKQYEIRV